MSSDNMVPEKDLMIFIVGNSRSGTTLLANILGRHPAIFTFNELHFFEELYVPATSKSELSREECVKLAGQLLVRQRLEYARFSGVKVPLPFLQEAASIVDSLQVPIHPTDVWEAFLYYETVRQSKTIPLEQTPRNVFYIRELLSRYPNAYVVNMIRDARDIVLSQKYKWRRFWSRKDTPKKLALLFWANYHPITISMMWNSAVKAAIPFQEEKRFIQVAFEDLVQQPAREVKRMCDWLGLAYSKEMLAVPANSSHSPEKDQEIGIRQDASGRWKKVKGNRRDLSICQAITQENLTAYHYELSERLTATYLDWGIALLSLPLKSTLSLLLNLRRTRYFSRFLKKRIFYQGAT